MREKFSLRKLKQLGQKLGYQLIDAAQPSQLFVELLKYRGGSGGIHPTRLDHDFLAFVLQHFSKSSAQLFQDLLVIYLTKEKQSGFFVEFGATNGITLSNSYLLEKEYGWHGILAEPARGWHNELRRNRKSIIETRCVWKASGEHLEFNEVAEGELSTINSFSDTDGHSVARKHGNKYVVDTISLRDLLVTHSSPKCIDYLSVDTEGSEYEILSHFNFTEYDVRILTVEHNYTPERRKIHDLLCANGYVRIFPYFSQWDDWYIKAE